ncbi:unnamed protein product [Staurois parvus]|uniref:Uncharacterized protein n=1 Tax=Staurois parvus TaxID=386267 RepID=A0ABN9FD17_9NEOB|nr:unnamed protein product [Staurois parvus]
MCTGGHWYCDIDGHDRWQLWALTGGTDAVSVRRGLPITGIYM